MDALAAGLELSERVAIVTGGTRGIGQAIAQRLAMAGAQVVTVGRSVEEKQVVDSLDHEPLALAGDVAVKADVERVVASVLARYGRIDILVNCAGVLRRMPALETSEADWAFMVDTNMKGAFLTAQAVAPIMRQAGRGRIVNVTSIGATLALVNRAAYCAAKAGLTQLTRCLALEWGGHGITANAIGPGIVETNMNRDYLEADQVRLQTMINKIPLGRLGRPDDISGAVLFLASDLANYITGQVLYVDGGWGLGDRDW